MLISIFMKCLSSIFIILIVFFKTGNVLSSEKIFNVNNIEILNESSKNNEELADIAIKKGFKYLTERILLKDDQKRVSGLELKKIKELVTYYQIVSDKSDNIKSDKLIYNILFDKDKLHNLFYVTGISYSDVTNQELFILPILKKNNQYFIYNKNYFYENWNKTDINDLIEFVLPLENIEIIQKINSNSNSLLDLDLISLFQEYDGKNLSLILIEENNLEREKIFIRLIVSNKVINKNLIIDRENLNQIQFYEKIITQIKEELSNLIKSKNLIDVRVPSFINVKFLLNKKNNLVELNKRLEKIDLIEKIYVQEFNNQFVLLKIKYLGKLVKIINQLKNEKIILKQSADQWSINLI